MSEKKSHKWRISAKEDGVKLLRFLQDRFPFLSSREIKKRLEKGLCSLNGQIERFSTTILEKGNLLILSSSWEQPAEKKKPVSIKVLFEDEYFYIIDKPSGILCSNESFYKLLHKKYYLAHRLDKETSGCLILVKDEKIRQKISKLFAKQEVNKTYLALVDKPLKRNNGTIKSYLSKKGYFHGQSIWGASSTGLFALTYFERLLVKDKMSAVLCFPKTGRTHQLRVHLSEMGHPILGDYQYCKRFQSTIEVSRVMLHSLEVSFQHPVTKKMVKVKAKVPKEFFLVFPELKIL